jgi:phage terminase large subunit-like protein
VVLPEGIVSSAYPSVRETCNSIGLGHDPWQAGTAQCILAKAADGDYAADTVVMSVPRQVGKTYLIGSIVFADCIVNPGTTVIWTAHRFGVARETFDSLAAIAKTSGLLPHIDPADIHSAAGNEVIGFRNGSRIKFAARERGTIRGVAKVRRLILDEAQILSESALSDLAPTMNQAENPQIIMMGTPPRPQDNSAIFSGLREEALDGESEGVVYIEFSADADADLDDRAQWHKANPSLGTRTPYKAIKRLRRLFDNEEDFAREALGIWTNDGSPAVIDLKTWRGLVDEVDETAGLIAYGIDVNPQRDRASIGMAGWRPDGRHLLDWVETRNSVDWVVDAARKITEKQRPIGFVVDAGSPAGSLIPALLNAKVPVIKIGSRDYGNACGMFYDECMGSIDEDGVYVPPRLTHLDQPPLNVALASARRRKLGQEGAWAWARVNTQADITPLVACTLALFGLSTKRRADPNAKQRIVVLS